MKKNKIKKKIITCISLLSLCLFAGFFIFGVNHIVDTFSNIKHLKIKNIYRSLYEKSGSSLPYDDWRKQEISRDLENHWREYLKLAAESAEGHDTIIMDTLYSTTDAIVLRKILGEQLSLLYIDAPFKSRVLREYHRLRTDSPNTDRKADLRIKLEDISTRTQQKDTKKQSEGMFDYPKLLLHADGTVSDKGEGKQLVYIVNNDQDEQTFHQRLDHYVRSVVLHRVNHNYRNQQKVRE